jgi:hypothetical protein
MCKTMIAKTNIMIIKEVIAAQKPFSVFWAPNLLSESINQKERNTENMICLTFNSFQHCSSIFWFNHLPLVLIIRYWELRKQK